MNTLVIPTLPASYRKRMRTCSAWPAEENRCELVFSLNLPLSTTLDVVFQYDRPLSSVAK